MCHVYVLMFFLFAGLITVTYTSADMGIRYPGDIVKYTPGGAVLFDSDLQNTEGFVLRVVNSTYHHPTILVAWKQSNYSSVSWENPQNLTLQSRSEAANWEEKPLDCKQMHGTPADYVSFISNRVKVGVLFRSLVTNETVWNGDVCIYLGTEGLKAPLKRLWCYRSEKLVTVDSFEDMQILGVTNFPGVYEYSENNELTGFYRYPILNKFDAIIQSKTMLQGQENTAFLAMHCNNKKNISAIVYYSLMHFNNYTEVTDMPISVPSNISLETKWIAEYLGPNYLEFAIIESTSNRIKTGVWYHVLESVKHETEIHAPGTDERFSLTNDQITITTTQKMQTLGIVACIFFNGSNNNETQYGFGEDADYVKNVTYKQPGFHQVFSMVWNQLSLEFMELSIMVARVFELESLTLTMDSYAVKTHEQNLKFYMRAFKGYVSFCNITYGDGMSSTYEKSLIDFIDLIENSVDLDKALKNDPGLEHDFIKSSAYSVPGLYQVQVSCENEINSMNYSKTIVVQDAIFNLSIFPIPPHEFGSPITVVWQVDKGTNVTVEIWYNDILCNTTNTIITNSQNNSCDCLVSDFTHYDTDNLVDIEIKAWNLVSNISKTVTVAIFEPMVITSLGALTSTAPWGSGVPGAGPDQNKFPVENLVIFKANYTGGPVTSHVWQLRRPTWHFNCTDCGSRTSNSIEGEFQFEIGDDICEIKLLTQNSAGMTEESITIDLDRSFNLQSVTINSPVIVNTTESLTIELGDLGAHTCIAVDFGDSSAIRLYGDNQSCEEQYNYTSKSDIVFNPTEINTSISVGHVFNTTGQYQVKVDGKNFVSSDSFEQEVVVVLLPCEYPNVTITGFNVTDQGSIPEHWKSLLLNLTTINEFDCEITESTQTNWTIYKLDQDPRAMLSKIDNIPRTEYEFLNPTNLTLSELILDSKSLEYGFYAVKARLEMDGLPHLFNEDTKYFHVIPTPFLEPALTTGFMYNVIFRKIAVLNSSATVDPDFEHLDGVTYEWFCRDIDDAVQFGPDYDSEPLLYVPVVNDTFPPAEANSTGCFGEGRGRLNVTDAILTIDSTFMVEGKDYIITLVTSKVDPIYGLRRSATEIYFQVALGLPPSLETSCIKNCQERVNPDEKLIIESTCTANCYGQLELKWILFWFDNIDMPEPFDLSELNEVSTETLSSMVTNPINELQMAFKANTLVPERKYILQLLAKRPNNVTGEVRNTMIINDAPKGGNCSISPPSGISMVTTFNITCSNWQDPNLPIKYEYAYVVNGVRSVFLTHTAESPGQTVISSSELPIGDPNRNNVLDIYVNIKDKFGSATEQNFTVKVVPPSNGEVNLNDLDNLLSGSGSPLDAGTNPQKVLAVAGVMASVLNHIDQSINGTSRNITAEEMARRRDQSEKVDELKQNILKSLSGINVTDMNMLLQLSGTMSTLTQNPENLSPATQEYGVQSCNAAVESLTKFSKGKSSFKDVQSAVTNLVSVVGQLILGSTKPPEQGNLTISESSVDRAQRTISMLNDLHEASLRYIVPNEGPTTINSALITLQSEKVSIRNMGKNGNAASNCGFKTPSPEVFGFGEIVKDVNATISQLDSVTIKMGVFDNNPYTWDNTSKTVTSKIASLNLASTKNMSTSNLTEDIGITISRDPSQFPEITSFFMKPDKPDPNFDGKLYLKYHCFNRTTRWTAMNFEIYPEDVSLNLKVYLKTGGKPDVKTGDFNLQYDLPDFSGCNLEVDENDRVQENETIVVDPFNHCALHPYSVFVSNLDFNKTGEHCFAIQIKNGSSNNIDSDSSSGNSRRKRSFACEVGKRRMRRSCVIIPPPPPPPPTESPFKVLVADNLGFDGKYFFPNETPNYNMSMYESSCLYWDEENQTWTGYGCRVGPLTSRTNIQCFCNHLTSFGSDLVVAPNPIDFNSVFNNFGSLQDNVAVLALISTVLGLYILGVLWGRRADKRDTLMVGPTILHNPQGTYHYLVTLYTGNRQGSGTTAKVFFKIAGDNDETLPVKLWDPKRPCFERAQENQFIVSYPQEVGNLSYVQIWHNNAGLSPSWYLSRVTVKDIQTNQQWYFVCDNWLAVESEDGKVCRVIPVANDQELTNFNQLFTARTVKGLADGHLWFSIFSRPPNSNFTRVQRLSCCLCLLCCTMITSAMFYNMGGDGPSPFAIHIGSLVIDLKQFVIALQSSLIIVPVNVAIVQIFRNLKPKKSKEEIYNEETEDNSENKENEGNKPKGKLPHWFIYIAYALCYLASAASIFFTLLYSIQWGKEKSTEWVIAMVTAFLQSVLLLQPVKVLILAVVFALFVRKPNDADDQDDTPVTYEQMNSLTPPKRRKKRKIYSPPDPETLREARIKRLNEIKMNKILKEIAAFFIFLIMLMNVAYYHRDSNTFLMTKTLFETFDEVDDYGIDLGAVSEGDSLWMWARETLVPGLYATEWYNGKKAQKGFIANMEAYLVGVPRIRLARVETDSCTIDKLFKDSIPHCYDAFSLTSEEDETFGVSWEPLSTGPARKRRDLYNTPETEEEWLEMMINTVKKETKTQDTLPKYFLPKKTHADRWNKDSSRQKRAVDPITSSVTGKNRRKKKRLLGSAKPKNYLISEQALLPNGQIMSCLERWRYQSTLELRGFPYWGAISLYSGGGYAANLGYNPLEAYTVISDLHSNGWIDVQSRATFIEFTVYNANTNLFGIVSIMVEFPSSSAAFTKVQYQSARFYLHLNSAQTVSHVLVIFFMMYFLYREGKLVYKLRWAYFKGFWNWVETILVVCEFMTIVLFLARLYEVDRNLLQLRENPNDYVPFQYAAGADAALCYVLGILVFFYTIRFLRLLRFNKNFAVLGKTLARISGPISGFCLPFFFAFLAFGLFAFSVFGTELQDYSSFQMTMVTQFSMTLGDFDFEALVMTNPLLGPLYFFGFVGMNVFILMNVFLAIINDSYAEVQEEEADTKNEYEILEYITAQIQLKIKGEPKKRKGRKARKVRPKPDRNNKPRYVTFRETEKKLSQRIEDDFQGKEEIYKALYENLFAQQFENNESFENICEDTPSGNENEESRPPVSTGSYAVPHFTPEMNVLKLDSRGEQLDTLLNKLQNAVSDEAQTFEAIGEISDENRQDICYRYLLTEL